MSNAANIEQSSEHSIRINGDLTAKTVNTCWQQQSDTIQRLQGQDQPLTVDFADLQNVDTAGLAWLLHVARDCNQHSVKLQLRHVPTALINLAKLSNVDQILPLD